MSEHRHKHVARIDPACASAVAALENDPFYRSICTACVHDAIRRRAVLAQYFAYSIQEGRDIGRCVHLADRARGVAVWLLPQAPDVQSRAAHNKRVFLETTLPAEGGANYYRIVNFMSTKAAGVVDDDAWYLSIVAVDPAAHGRGLGRKLLEPTLAEADRVSATCYLETFSPRSLSFYERLGFAAEAWFAEPTTGADYAVMVRYPSAPRWMGGPQGTCTLSTLKS
jgi:GNAT superfamily N-acetyltransferase